LADEVLQLFLLREGMLDEIPVKQVHDFAVEFTGYVKNVYLELYDRIQENKVLTKEDMEQLRQVAGEFKQAFAIT
jgi:F0F1-type ATP synthase alpha subunit